MLPTPNQRHVRIVRGWLKLAAIVAAVIVCLNWPAMSLYLWPVGFFIPGCYACDCNTPDPTCGSCTSGTLTNDLEVELSGVAAGCAECTNFNSLTLTFERSSGCTYVLGTDQNLGGFGGGICASSWANSSFQWVSNANTLDMRHGLGCIDGVFSESATSPRNCGSTVTPPALGSSGCGLGPACDFTAASATVNPV
jgi:hypothetical protein